MIPVKMPLMGITVMVPIELTDQISEMICAEINVMYIKYITPLKTYIYKRKDVLSR